MKPKHAGRSLHVKSPGTRTVIPRKPNVIKKRLLKSLNRGIKKSAMKWKQKQWTKMRKGSSSSSASWQEQRDNDEPVLTDVSPKYDFMHGSDDEANDESEEAAFSDTSERKSIPGLMDSTSHRQALMSLMKSSSDESKSENDIDSSESEENSQSTGEDIQEIRNFWFFESELCDTAVLVLRHPCQLVLSGCLKIRALSGSFDIHGWQLSSDVSDEFEFIPVYSSVHYGRYILSTTGIERVPKRVSLAKHLSARLLSVSAELFVSSVLSVATGDCVMVAITRLDTSWPVHYASSMLTPSLFQPEPGPYLSKRLGFSICPNLKGALVVTKEHSRIADQICHAVQYARSIGSPAPRIVICGDRDSGKSTFMRYLINSVLSSGCCPSVCHLDGDPGQAEFTPSSCVSLTSVDSPLLGPPFTHHKTPIRQCFVGGASVEDTPDIYSESLHSLINHYNDNYSSEPLFVNTMGWSRGLGLSLLVDVLRLSCPSLVIQMDSLQSSLPVVNSKFMIEECGWISNRAQAMGHMDTEFVRVIAVEKQIVSTSEAQQVGLAAPLQRLLSALTYLGRVLANSIEHELLRVQPKCVPITEVAVLLSGRVSVKQEKLLQVINGSWVALCSQPTQVPDTSATLPKIVKIVPNICIGFGLVRGIDLIQGVILVLTPEPLFRLQEVNAIAVVGDLLPAQVFTTQRTEGPVPYVSRTSVMNKSGLGVKVKQKRKVL